jgi:HD superfamily phosphohydrolase
VLADVRNTVIRDNVENNRLISVSEKIRRVINSYEFQRLRHIRQMGMSSYVFPTAEHSRFAHSLGVYCTARNAFGHLQRRAIPFDFETPGIKFDDDLELEFSIAALCHDVGHSAFSHVLETILLPDGIRNHEECTRAILSDTTKGIGAAINNISDLQSVLFLLEKRHPNKALADLISSTFDVDRCDYVLRDSAMAGVEYGSYDLKWLLHAMSIETNSRNEPVLLLDGPRGLDALRQFLSARRYLHRQVYLHPTVRSAQILLKAIFSRIQDLPPSDETKALTPKCLHPIVDHNKLALGDFLDARDAEINVMIANFANHPHPDSTLCYLAKQLVHRELPKCVLDSARSAAVISKTFCIQDGFADSSEGLSAFTDVVEELRKLVADLMRRQGLPPDVASYLVTYDPVSFESSAPTDILFSFGEKTLTFPEIDPQCVGFDVDSLLDTFVIHRVFVPRGFEQPSRELLNDKYAIINSESGGSDG